MSEIIYKLPKGTYAGTANSLGVIHPDTGKVVWYTCRDQFHAATENRADIISFLFVFDGKAENVIDFLRTVEQIVRVPPDQELVFTKTQSAQMLKITMSPWWWYRLRRSLLTALCRCGQAYTERNGIAFSKALWSMTYTKATEVAVRRFLAGYTAAKMKKRLHFTGWQNLFHGNVADTANHILVKLKRRRDEPEEK